MEGLKPVSSPYADRTQEAQRSGRSRKSETLKATKERVQKAYERIMKEITGIGRDVDKYA